MERVVSSANSGISDNIKNKTEKTWKFFKYIGGC